MSTNRIFIKDILNNSDFFINKPFLDLYCCIDNLQEKSAKNNSSYIEFTGKDKTGSINCKSWGTKLDDLSIKNGDIVKIRCKFKKHNDTNQLIIEKDKNKTLLLRIADDNDFKIIRVDDFYKTSPTSFKEMYEYLISTINTFHNEELKRICLLFMKKYKTELEYYPGAKANHHAYKTGLIYHIYNMARQGVEVAKIYNLNKDLLLSGVILHDIGKIETMNSTEQGIVTDFTAEGVLFEHIIQVILMIENLAREANISYDKKTLLIHMVLSHHGKPEWGSCRYPAFAEAEALHHLDNMDAKINAILENLEGISNDTNVTGPIRSLDGRVLYKHNLEK